MYTHVCIKTATKHASDISPRIKKGDYATLIREENYGKAIDGEVALIFKEDQDVVYSAELFLPLPPQQEKSVYVAVSETLKETILEPILN